MARYFLDSSALVKRYHAESGSADVQQLFREPAAQFFVSRLALVEVHSTLARLVREKVLSESDFQNLVARLDDDVAVQCDRFPPDLLRLAGDMGLGIEISLYPSMREDPE